MWGLALLAAPLTGADWLFRFQNGTSWLENSNSIQKSIVRMPVTKLLHKLRLPFPLSCDLLTCRI
jgi:hypothetical protein